MLLGRFVEPKYRNQLGVIAMCLAAFCAQAVGPIAREPNTTLNLPLTPPSQGYRFVDAFPGQAFSNPIAIATPPGETNRLFVAERSGRIYCLTNLAAPVRSIFLDLRSRVVTEGEGGLTGLAFHPGFATNGAFFVFYTRSNRLDEAEGLYDQLSRFNTVPGNSALADVSSETTLIAQFDENFAHQGGDIHFGPDGYLYVSLGDEGGGGDQFQNSQRIDKDFFSGILRLDVDHRPGSLAPNPHPAINGAYSIPPDNPFVGATSFNGQPVNPAAVRTEFWAVGLRNPYRITFDPYGGALYCADVGQAAREEINLIEKGRNYGWNYYEGALNYVGRPGPPPAGVEFTMPLYEYDHNTSGNYDPLFSGLCVIGGIVYRGLELSQLHGSYIFSDFLSQHVWAMRTDGGSPLVSRLLTHSQRIYSYGRDPRNGDVLASGPTALLRLEYDETPSGDPLPETLSDTGAFSDLTTLTPNAGIVPYDINHPFWSDHAIKSRWFSLPSLDQTITYQERGLWSFPEGGVWIKHFDLELETGNPASRRRLETRFLVKNSSGVYGVTYRWNESQTEAYLVPEEGMDEEIEVVTDGVPETRKWHYPGRAECTVCHNSTAGHILGFTTQQLNLSRDYGDGPINQILALAQAGYFSNPPSSVDNAPALAAINDTTAGLQHRVRSYLDANCAYCHQPGGSGRGSWDGRINTPLHAAGILNGPVDNNLGSPGAAVLKPGRPDLSVALERISRWDGIHMPPLATAVLNQDAIDLLQQWLTEGVFVQGRHVFYNNSFWDGNDPAANEADDDAIAPDKTALLPGGSASFANYTSYSRGINGVMIDVLNLAGTPSAADFSFRVGNNNTLADWNSAPSPAQIAVRKGAGVDGSDRVSLVWGSDAVSGAWLEITMNPTPTTGLEVPDVFYFGNAVGESGNEANRARVDPADELLARANPRNVFNPAPIDFPYDYNRDGHVDPADELIARANTTTVFSELRLIDLTGSETFLDVDRTVEVAQPALEVRVVGQRSLSSGSRGSRLQIVLKAPNASGWRLETCLESSPGEWRPVRAAGRAAGDGSAWVWEIPCPPDSPAAFFRATRIERAGK